MGVWVQDASRCVVDQVLDLLPLPGCAVLLRLAEFLGEPAGSAALVVDDADGAPVNAQVDAVHGAPQAHDDVVRDPEFHDRVSVEAESLLGRRRSGRWLSTDLDRVDLEKCGQSGHDDFVAALPRRLPARQALAGSRRDLGVDHAAQVADSRRGPRLTSVGQGSGGAGLLDEMLERRVEQGAHVVGSNGVDGVLELVGGEPEDALHEEVVRAVEVLLDAGGRQIAIIERPHAARDFEIAEVRTGLRFRPSSDAGDAWKQRCIGSRA